MLILPTRSTAAVMASPVTNLLSPYLPPQYLAVVSVALRGIERLVLPTIRAAHYTLTTLDPNSLVPLAISLVTLYLTLLSFWYTARMGMRMAWFAVKWGAVLAVVWLILGGDLAGLSLGGKGSASLNGPDPIGRRGGQWWADWNQQRRGYSGSSYAYPAGDRPPSDDPLAALGDRFLSFFSNGPTAPLPFPGPPATPAGASSGSRPGIRRRKGTSPDNEAAADFQALRRVGGMLSRAVTGSLGAWTGQAEGARSDEIPRGPTRNR